MVQNAVEARTIRVRAAHGRLRPTARPAVASANDPEIRTGGIDGVAALCLLLRERIRAGFYGVAGRIPDEAQLLREFGVSRTRLRAALDVLTLEGTIERRRGRGTFVSDRRVTHRPHASGGILNALAQQRVTGRHELLTASSWAMDPLSAAEFCTHPGVPMHVIERLTKIEGEPNHLATYVVRGDLAPTMLSPDLKDAALDMRIWLERALTVEIDTVDWFIEAVLADPQSARLLNAEPGTALIRMSRYFRDAEGRLLAYGTTSARGDRFVYQAVSEHTQESSSILADPG